LLKYISVAILVIIILWHLIHGDYNKWKFTIAAGVIALATIFGGNFQLFTYAALVFAAIDIDVKKLLKIFSIEVLVLLVLMIFLPSVNIFPNIILDATRTRYSLGFSWVTLAPTFWLFLLFVYYFDNNKHTSLQQNLLFILISSLLYILTNSRLFYIIQLLLIAVEGIAQYTSEKKLTITVKLTWLKWLPFVLFACSLLLAFFYSKSPIWIILNNMLSGRLELAHTALANYGISLFGKDITWIGYSANYKATDVYNFVDNSYLNIMFSYGISSLLLVLYSYYKKLESLVSLKLYNQTIVIVLILLLCISEPRLISFPYNPFILMFADLLKNKSTLSEQSEMQKELQK
jgi:hypothetical protein